MPENKEKIMKKCNYYKEWTWGEPPLDEGENGRLWTERECDNAKGYFVASCEGNPQFCDLGKHQAKSLKYPFINSKVEANP